MGVGVAFAEIGDIERVASDTTSESVVEFFYSLPITPWMTLIPDIQWVNRPSGLDGSAFVAGLRVATVF
jgi:carbohydrate-selective porin OprB